MVLQPPVKREPFHPPEREPIPDEQDAAESTALPAESSLPLIAELPAALALPPVIEAPTVKLETVSEGISPTNSPGLPPDEFGAGVEEPAR